MLQVFARDFCLATLAWGCPHSVQSVQCTLVLLCYLVYYAQEPTPGSAVEFWGESVRKNRPLVPRSNIAGSWAQGGGG